VPPDGCGLVAVLWILTTAIALGAMFRFSPFTSAAVAVLVCGIVLVLLSLPFFVRL
jgi:hypothetical protein